MKSKLYILFFLTFLVQHANANNYASLAQTFIDSSTWEEAKISLDYYNCDYNWAHFNLEFSKNLNLWAAEHGSLNDADGNLNRYLLYYYGSIIVALNFYEEAVWSFLKNEKGKILLNGLCGIAFTGLAWLCQKLKVKMQKDINRFNRIKKLIEYIDSYS